MVEAMYLKQPLLLRKEESWVVNPAEVGSPEEADQRPSGTCEIHGTNPRNAERDT
ncbi:MAG: hypothetical protein Kow001_06930 [Acidobacteriota bacterium]